jgi:hypothetical protein
VTSWIGPVVQKSKPIHEVTRTNTNQNTKPLKRLQASKSLLALG